jgi:hypothetical protein
VTDYGATSAQCLYCHGDSQVNRAANHPSASGTPLDGTPEHLTAGCTGCHKLARTEKPFAADWAKTDCLACHPGGPPPQN